MKVNLSIPINVWNEKSENDSQNHSKSAKNKENKNENKNRQKIHMVWCGKEL